MRYENIPIAGDVAYAWELARAAHKKIINGFADDFDGYEQYLEPWWHNRNRKADSPIKIKGVHLAINAVSGAKVKWVHTPLGLVFNSHKPMLRVLQSNGLNHTYKSIFFTDADSFVVAYTKAVEHIALLRGWEEYIPRMMDELPPYGMVCANVMIKAEKMRLDFVNLDKTRDIKCLT